MQRGNTFTFTTLDRHLWIILSCPAIDPDRVLTVNLSTYTQFKEGVCILDVGDHPWIEHETCVMYERAQIRTLGVLEDMLNRKAIAMNAPMSEEVLNRIYYGAEESTRMPLEYAALLEEQHLIFTDSS